MYKRQGAYNLLGLGLLTARAARQAGGLGRTLRAQPRRYGAYLSHAGLIVLALGLAFSGTYRRDAQVTLNMNQGVHLLNEDLTLTGLENVARPDGRSIVARVLIDGRPFSARLNTYTQGGDTPFPSPAVRYGLTGDTYLVMTGVDPEGQWASVRLIESPLVSWIWWGTLLVCVGAAFTLVTPRRAPQAAPARLAPATD